MKNKMNRVH